MPNLLFCATPNDQDSKGVEIPGIGILKPIKSSIDSAPSPFDLAATALGQIGPALAPIMQVIRVIDVVLQIVECIKAVKNPFKLKKKIKSLAKAIAALSIFIPGLNYVRTVRDLVDLISSIIRGLAGLIDRWIFELSQISNMFAVAAALDDPEITVIINCSKERLIEVQAGATSTLQDLGKILEVVTKLVEILKTIIPGQITKDFLNAIERLALIPLSLTNVSASLENANNSSAVEVVVSDLRTIAGTLTDVADRLDSVSATLSSLVGKQ